MKRVKLKICKCEFLYSIYLCIVRKFPFLLVGYIVCDTYSIIKI